MASEFQRRKVAAVFDAMDVDGDGSLTKEDFEKLAARWTAVRELPEDSEEYRSISGVMMGWWDSVSALVDEDRDKKITMDEVMAAVDYVMQDSTQNVATANAMFDVMDEDKDGKISADEYRHVITGWKGDDADTSGIFAQLDLDSDGTISREEFLQLWYDFWAGDDESSPGRLVFGPY